METVSKTIIDLDEVDFAGVARAYKIIYLHSIGKSRILELFFDSDQEQIESWNNDNTEKNPELEARFAEWYAFNSERIEVDIASRMVFDEIEFSKKHTHLVEERFGPLNLKEDEGR